MLSICIPVFNWDITQLVHALHKQADRLNVPAEIVLLDDGSRPQIKEANRPLADLPLVKYEELKENAGRSRIRNLLFDKSSYRYLLILDCDTMVTSHGYLKKYLETAFSGIVVCGGRTYGEKPVNRKELLHWLVGSKREVNTAAQRQKNSYHDFITGNFMIDRQVFEKIRFHESLSGYGHEDTLFGYELFKHKIPVEHIDNPLVHLGLENTDEFLRKTTEGLQNLIKTYELVNHDPEYARMVKILRIYLRIRKFGLHKLLGKLSGVLEKPMEQHLKGTHPSLLIFDLYKLCMLCRHH